MPVTHIPHECENVGSRPIHRIAGRSHRRLLQLLQGQTERELVRNPEILLHSISRYYKFLPSPQQEAFLSEVNRKAARTQRRARGATPCALAGALDDAQREGARERVGCLSF